MKLYSFVFLSLLFLVFQSNQHVYSQKIYVSLKGSTDGDGSSKSPFNTIQKALDHTKKLKENRQYPKEGISIVMEEGNYLLKETLFFSKDYSGLPDAPVIIKAREPGKVVFSGGLEVKKWSRVDSNLFVAKIPVSEDWYPKQLFLNNKQMSRASIPYEGFLLTEGPLSKYSIIKTWKPYAFAKAKALQNDGMEAFCGFQYKEKDKEIWEKFDFENAEIITYHSWECSWQLIDHIDPATRDVHLTSPSRYPVGFFDNELRYRIENVSVGLNRPGKWYFDKKESLLYFLAPEGVDPNTEKIIVSFLDELIRISGISPEDKVTHLRFEGITFSHSDYNMKFNQKQRNWYKEHKTWGYSDTQAALNSGNAILVQNAENIVFDGCIFKDIGSYALNISIACENIYVVNNHFQALGSGAILLGSQNHKIKENSISRNNRIENNTIEQYGTIHPGGVGIWLANAENNMIVNNEIRYGGYSGISLGWTWGEGKNHTSNNLIARNNIHHVMQELADGGGIYTLGSQTNTVIEENYIHSIGRNKYAIGSPNNGIFFDEGSSQITVRNNILINLKASTFRLNKAQKSKLQLSDTDPTDDKNRERIIHAAGVKN